MPGRTEREFRLLEPTEAQTRLAWLEEQLRRAGVTVMASGAVHIEGAPTLRGQSMSEGQWRNWPKPPPVEYPGRPVVPREPEPPRRSLRCRLGWHKIDTCSGVGPCRRPGCGHVVRARALPRGGWIRHVEPPTGPRPMGMPAAHNHPAGTICGESCPADWMRRAGRAVRP